METNSSFNQDENQIFYEFSYDYAVSWRKKSLGEFFVTGEGEEAGDIFISTESAFRCPTQNTPNP